MELSFVLLMLGIVAAIALLIVGIFALTRPVSGHRYGVRRSGDGNNYFAGDVGSDGGDGGGGSD